MPHLDEELMKIDTAELLKRFHNRDREAIYKYAMERSRAIKAGEVEQGDPTTTREKELWKLHKKQNNSKET